MDSSTVHALLTIWGIWTVLVETKLKRQRQSKICNQEQNVFWVSLLVLNLNTFCKKSILNVSRLKF